MMIRTFVYNTILGVLFSVHFQIVFWPKDVQFEVFLIMFAIL
jgi:hypothetical protein